MTRNTSIEAYATICENGLLSKARLAIYKALFQNGPLTAGELFEKLQSDKTTHTVVKGSVCARLTELREHGVVSEVGSKAWGKTGHTNILWDVTSKLPEVPPARQTKDQIIKQLNDKVALLECIIARKDNELSFIKSRSEQLTLFKAS
jgi:predicted transcriptional regulator